MGDRAEVVATALAPRSVAGIGAFRDRQRLLDALQEELGIAVPTTCGFVTAGALRVSCLAPRRFLVCGDRTAGLPKRLEGKLAGLGAVTDQSDLWEGVQVSGPDAAGLLARLLPVDLDPAVFGIGGFAATRAGHVDARVWRVAAAEYELAVARSHGADLRHALQLLGAVSARSATGETYARSVTAT